MNPQITMAQLHGGRCSGIAQSCNKEAQNTILPSEVRFRRIIHLLGRWWSIPALGAGMGLTLASLYLALTPPRFVSKAVLWETEKLRLPDTASFTSDVQSHFGTQIDLLRSEQLFQLATERFLRLGFGATINLNRSTRLVSEVKVRPMPRSTFVTVEVYGNSPDHAQKFLDCFLAEYLNFSKSVRDTASNEANACISNQVSSLYRSLADERDALTAFQQTNNPAILEEEGKIAGGYLARLGTQLSDLGLELQLLEATQVQLTNYFQQLADNDTPAEPIVWPEGQGTWLSSDHSSTLKDYARLRIQREAFGKYMRPTHPKIVKLEESVEQARRLLEFYGEQVNRQLGASRHSLQMRVESVQGSIHEWQEKVLAIDQRIAAAERLKQSVNEVQTTYERLLSLQNHVRISRALHSQGLTLLQPASEPARSYRKVATVPAVAAFVGLGMGMGIVVLMERKEDRFLSLTELTTNLSFPVLGHIPDGPEAAFSSLAFDSTNAGCCKDCAESFRNLRSAVLFTPGAQKEARILLVTSASPKEGKSFVATSLASCLAAGGSSVLLVDADMTNGTLHQSLKVPSSPGFAELLTSTAPLNGFVYTQKMPHLFFLPHGLSLSRLSDGLLSDNFSKIIDHWRDSFDYTLIDGDSLLACEDAITLAALVDRTLLVVRNGFSRISALEAASKQLSQRGCKVLGVVVNRCKSSFFVASAHRSQATG